MAQLSIKAFERIYGAPEEVRYEFSYGEDLIGVASVSSMADSYFIHCITVMPDDRGKGYGSMILDSLCKMFNDKPIRLELDASSPMGIDNLRAWYERRGFQHVSGEEMVRQPNSTSQ